MNMKNKKALCDQRASLNNLELNDSITKTTEFKEGSEYKAFLNGVKYLVWIPNKDQKARQELGTGTDEELVSRAINHNHCFKHIKANTWDELQDYSILLKTIVTEVSSFDKN